MPDILDRLTRARRRVRRTFVAIAVGLISLCAVWASAAPAAAHDELVSSDPSEAGVVTTWPSRVILTFSGEVSEVHEITVTGPDGSVTNGDPTASGTEVRQTVGTGPHGSYTMTYDVVSADGHEIAGEITFDVEAGSTSADPMAADDPSDASAVSAEPAQESSDGMGVAVPVLGLLAALAVAAAVLLRRRTDATRES